MGSLRSLIFLKRLATSFKRVVVAVWLISFLLTLTNFVVDKLFAWFAVALKGFEGRFYRTSIECDLC